MVGVLNSDEGADACAGIWSTVLSHGISNHHRYICSVNSILQFPPIENFYIQCVYYV